MKIEYLYPIWFVLCALAGAIIGRVTGYGVMHGLTDGMLAAALPILLLILGYALKSFWRPILPPCRCRQCSHKGYQYVAPADGLQVGGPVRFRCPRCGRTYELHREQFRELTQDGDTLPYMRHTKWGRWKEARA